ncbi:hypothetical protein [Ancylomarina sp. 16SWW S1-10-2]|uniref:hypothetical protein n=1 Tax=Ancylomarina sp. 16SWW S1-10-2 TaxID=2499681 RepID=UPI0012ADCD8B|nr:hypothetical protein [Ancylomarina sp. 16SWW S1-10-2]MRT93127.1 hypothetical protein [Ancylomarina sp. 16SWW S1-10-2]
MNDNLILQAQKFELHYFFNDKSHLLNAFVRNKCESELLSIAKEVAKILEVDIEIDSEALQEGGLVDIWKFLGKNSGQIAIVIAILTLIMSRVPLNNSELSNLQIENAKLEKIERLLRIKKLKQESNQSETVDYDKINDLIDTTVSHLSQEIKVKKHKSNFFTSISKTSKVTHLTARALTDNYIEINKTEVVKSDFANHILETDDLPTKIDEDATIEIVAPVLKKGKYKWKGTYAKLDKIIDFSIKDNKFKTEVQQGQIPFISGTCMDCILEIKQKVDEFGEIKNKGYSVAKVLRVHDETTSFETEQGRKHRKEKNAEIIQMSLFDKENDV